MKDLPKVPMWRLERESKNNTKSKSLMLLEFVGEPIIIHIIHLYANPNALLIRRPLPVDIAK